MAGQVQNVNSAQAPNDSPSESISYFGIPNDAYLVTLSLAPGDTSVGTSANQFPMIGWMGDKYEIQMRSQWDAPFAKSSVSEGVMGLIKTKFKGVPDISGAIDGLLGVAGIGTRLKSQTAQIWQSSDPLSFSFEFNFVAINNAASDVTAKIVALLKLAAPSEMAGGVLRAPGPIMSSRMIKAAATATNSAIGSEFSPSSRRITLKVGNFMLLEDVIITSVSSAVSGLMDDKGSPIFAAVNLSVESYYSCFTVEDIDKAFSPSLQQSKK